MGHMHFLSKPGVVRVSLGSGGGRGCIALIECQFKNIKPSQENLSSLGDEL